MRWSLKVIGRDGTESYVREEPSDRVTTYASRQRAEKQAEFWRDGLGDEVQSVNVVPAPKKA